MRSRKLCAVLLIALVPVSAVRALAQDVLIASVHEASDMGNGRNYVGVVDAPEATAAKPGGAERLPKLSETVAEMRITGVHRFVSASAPAAQGQGSSFPPTRRHNQNVQTYIVGGAILVTAVVLAAVYLSQRD